MGNNYKVKVRVQIKECADAVTDAPRREGVGVFESVLSAEQGWSIDGCEQIPLQTNYAAPRDAFAHHLSSVPRRYGQDAAGCLVGCKLKPYRVEGENGR